MKCPICAGAAWLKIEEGEYRGIPVKIIWVEYIIAAAR